MRRAKILLSVLLLIAILVSIQWSAAEEDAAPEEAPPIPAPVVVSRTTKQAPPPVMVTEYKSEASEAWLWDTISLYVPSDAITAGIMGYFWRESFFRSDAVGGWTDSLAYSGDDHCVLFTAEIDAGLADGSTKEEFIARAHDQYGGYGLGQWSSLHYTEALYDYAQEWGSGTIADAEMQIAFTVQSMMDTPELWEQLIETDDPYRAGWLIATLYDGTWKGAEYIGQMAGVFYERRADNV